MLYKSSTKCEAKSWARNRTNDEEGRITLQDSTQQLFRGSTTDLYFSNETNKPGIVSVEDDADDPVRPSCAIWVAMAR